MNAIAGSLERPGASEMREPSMYRWNASAPIYLQLADLLCVSILEEFEDGDALPSVRQLASNYRVNPLTVGRAVECLRKQGWVEVRAGVGTFVGVGAKHSIVQFGRTAFLEGEWPTLRERLRRLQIAAGDLS